MEWMMMNMDRFFAPTIQLGGYVGEDKYVVAPNCRAKVEEILHRLNQDKARWHFRRSLFMNKIISKNLLPTLIHVKDDRGVMEAIIKVLQELMTPVECLMPVEIMGRNYEGRHIVHELESSIVMTKKLFLDTRVTKALIDLMSTVLQHLWNVTLVQLVSLMYREQQQSTIRKLIHEWLESSLSESSEDDENNTMSSSSSDAISTSDPVSDSSERLSPVDSVNKGEKTHPNVNESNENSDTSRIAKTDKEDSCKDSGFGRSGSNMDSSPEESVSEGTSQHMGMQKTWNSTSTNDDSQQYSTDQTSSVNNLDQVQNINVQHSENKLENVCIDQMETSPLGLDNVKDSACDMKDELSERESDQGGSGGSEGGSEGSSPVPAMGQESPISQIDIDSRDPNPPQYIHNVEDEILTAVGSLLMEDGGCDPTPLRVETIDNMGQMDEEVNQQMCSSQESIKRPPNKEESGSSGDSSEKKPPPQLPKLLKNKPLTGQKRSRHTMSQKMLSESQENNESSNSTGSECDEGPHAKRPHHQKPHKMLSKPRPAKMLQKALQERNIKRSKLMKRKESNSIKAKALLHHHPTADDISNLLKEFTVDFMLNGYSNMVQGLRLQVMLPYQIDLDKSHVLWLITYFLRFAVELDLELSQICPVLSVDVVSYLVYEGVVMQEELEQAVRSGEDNLLPHVRRLHLVVTALREFFVALDVCLKKEQNLCNAGNLLQIKADSDDAAEDFPGKRRCWSASRLQLPSKRVGQASRQRKNAKNLSNLVLELLETRPIMQRRTQLVTQDCTCMAVQEIKPDKLINFAM
ncbi:protein timeless-like [Penaeus indicus]|uniref:protein timeless-like n=1 Tax=Penaeus indicus TaxID=29960 RepID=UPI00300D221E